MRTGPSFGFQAKVLLPVIAVMVGLVALTLVLVNTRISASMDKEMSRKLITADAVFRNVQAIRVKNLLLRYRNIPNEPRFRAVVQHTDPNTIRFMLHELAGELGADVVAFAGPAEERIAVATQESAAHAEAFLDAASELVREGLRGQPVGDLMVLDERLLDVVAVPVLIGDIVIGCLLVGSVMGDSVAREMSELTDCQLVLLADGYPLLSTVNELGFWSRMSDLYRNRKPGEAVKTLVGDDHYLALANRLVARDPGADIGYVLLSSYEGALWGLRETRRMLLAVGLLGTLFGALVVWGLVRNVTRPLRLLRDSAEAVGRGDYSQRVVVASRDECGELAQVFNAMMINVQASRDNVEAAMEALRRTQEQLIQREKLSAIGEFVAGVTHELNNPLTAVIGYADLLESSGLDEAQRRDAAAIVASARRCQKIVQDLLGFARQQKTERRAVKLNEVVQTVIGFMQYELRKAKIDLVTRFDSTLPSVMADAAHVQQVFVNIIQNARQALEATPGAPRIEIVTERAGDKIRVTITDNGPGIAPEVASRIFDPFFTTKPVGKGTGLGLSLSYGIIKDHGGSISLQSAPGAGAAFVVELPVCADRLDADQGPPPSGM